MIHFQEQLTLKTPFSSYRLGPKGVDVVGQLCQQ